MAVKHYSRILTTGPRTRVEFLLLGSRILGISIQGVITQDYLEQIRKQRRLFIEDLGLQDMYFIEFRDYTGINNLSGNLFKAFKEDLLRNLEESEQYNPLALYMVKMPLLLKAIRKLILAQRQESFITEYCDDMYLVYQKSLNLLYERGVYSFAEKSRVTGREWFFENDHYRESMQMLTDDLIYSECRGILNNFDEVNRRRSWETLLSSQPTLRKGFTLIFGLKEFDFTQDVLNNIFSSLWLETLMHNKCQKIIIITNQDSIAVNIAQLLTLNPIPHKVEKRFSSALQGLFPRLNQRHYKKKQQTGDLNKSDLEKLENYLLSLDVKISRKNQLISSETLRENDPLKPIYQSVNLFFSQVRDDFLFINKDWKRLNGRVKTAEILQGLYQILYKKRNKTLELGQALDELAELMNDTLDKGRVSSFHFSGGAYRCNQSRDKNRSSLKGTIIPDSVITSLVKKQIHIINASEWLEYFTPDEQLVIGPFLHSFLRSQKIDEFHFRSFQPPNASQGKLLMVDFQANNSSNMTEDAIIDPLLDEIEVLLKDYFKDEIIQTELEQDPVILKEALSEYDHDEPFYQEVLGKFLEELQAQWIQMEMHIQEKKWEHLRQESHKIKGGSANLYAKDLQEASRKLEAACQNAEETLIKDYYQLVKQEAQRLQEWYRKLW